MELNCLHLAKYFIRILSSFIVLSCVNVGAWDIGPSLFHLLISNQYSTLQMYLKTYYIPYISYTFPNEVTSLRQGLIVYNLNMNCKINPPLFSNGTLILIIMMVLMKVLGVVMKNIMKLELLSDSDLV